MDAKDLEAKVQERIKQALERKIFEKTSTVARYLGTCQDSSYKRDGVLKSNEHYSYQRERLRFQLFDVSSCDKLHGSYIPAYGIKQEPVLLDYSKKVNIFDGDQLVFLEEKEFVPKREDSIKVYVPGPWENTLRTLYLEAQHKQEQTKKNEEGKKN